MSTPLMISKLSLTFAWPQDGVAAKISNLDHHAIVNHTVCGLEATMDLNIARVQV